MWLTITIPLSTATPNSAIKPIEAEKLRLIPGSHRALIPPTSANGTLNRIKNVCPPVLEGREQKREDQNDRDRNTISSLRSVRC